jgi:hypothetical protein
MKKIVYTLIFSAFAAVQSFAQADGPVVVGGAQKGNANATMEVLSKGGTKGFMPPRLTTAQVTALGSNLDTASTGLTVYNTETGCLQSWIGTKWSECNTYSNAVITVDCASSAIKGTYSLDKVVDDNDYMEVKVNVSKSGPFVFYSDSKNGVRFYLSTILEAGDNQVIQVPALGTPKAVGDFTYNLFDQAGKALCAGNADFKTTVVDNKAKFTIKCSETAIVGNFYDDVAADSQTLVVKVQVASAGNYYIKTDTVDGLWFEGSGNINYGSTEIVLTAKGVANTIVGDTGVRTFTLQEKDGTSLGCTVTTSLMAAKAVFTLDCSTAKMLGTNYIFVPNYVFRDVDKLTVDINVTRPGPISLFTDTTQPVGYSFVGNIEKTGLQTVTLTPTKIALNYQGPWEIAGDRTFFTLKFFNFGTDTGCSKALFYRIWDYVAEYKFLNTVIDPELQQYDKDVFDKIKLFVPVTGEPVAYLPANFESAGMINFTGTAGGITIYFAGTGGSAGQTFIAAYIKGTLTTRGLVTFPMYDNLTGNFLGGFTINFKG